MGTLPPTPPPPLLLLLLLLLLEAAAFASAVLAPPTAPGLRVSSAVQRRKRAAKYPLGAASVPDWRLRNYSQDLDHFNFMTGSDAGITKFSQRYIVMNEKSFRANHSATNGTAPIFFFTGAEGGDIESVAWVYGSVIDMAVEMGGLICFAEHRFFGGSVPIFPPSAGGTATPGMATPTARPPHRDKRAAAFAARADRIGLLSIEQGLADYATLVSHIRDDYDSWNAPVITFGGSLSGTMAALMRLRYPQLVDMAYSSSAPLYGYPGLTDPFAWHRQVTADWEAVGGPGIAPLIRRGFSALQALENLPDVNQTAHAPLLHKLYQTCEKPGDPLLSASTLQGLGWQKLEGDAEFSYPPSVSSNETIGPACARITAAANRTSTPGFGLGDLAIFAALLGPVSVGQKCRNLTEATAPDHSFDAQGWNYLACTEIIHPIAANNVTDFFPPYNFSLAGLEAECRQGMTPGHPGYNVTARPKWIPEQFGLAHFARFGRLPSSTSRIVFVYGLADPWHNSGLPVFGPTGNLKRQLNSETEVVAIPGGGHCSDTAPADPATDTAVMLQARVKISNILRGWIRDTTVGKELIEGRH